MTGVKSLAFELTADLRLSSLRTRSVMFRT